MTFEYLNRSRLIHERYTRRFDDLGPCPKALGWGSADDQSVRFDQVLRLIPMSPEISVIDIGCGFADFYDFIPDEIKPKTYVGLDITTKFLEIARNKFKGDERVVIANDDILNYMGEPSDYGLMLGLLNFNWKDEDDTSFSHEMIEAAFRKVKKGLVVDFLSSHLDPVYPKEDGVIYHEPGKIIDFAMSLTNKVSLLHDYPSIPQREFMVFLQK